MIHSPLLKKAASSIWYTCMHIIFYDKGYAHVAVMKSVSEFPKDLKMFSKEVGVTEYIKTDSHKCQKSKEVRKFCHRIGTTLRILEGLTQWSNRDEI